MDWFREEDLLGCSCYIAQHNDDEVLARCASGGAFAAIACSFVEDGGVVFGASYDSEMRVAHTAARSIDELRCMFGSKYAQSILGNSFSLVERYLRESMKVLFSGTPCQIAGLYAFLKARNIDEMKLENLFTVDFVCHGVGSPMVLESYVSEERASGHAIAAMNMRSKYHGYRNTTMELIEANGKVRHVSTRVDRYLGAFYSNCISRPSCHECVFKGVSRPSSITLWDSWNAEAVIGKKPDNKGYTNMIVRGEKGEKLLLPAKSVLSLTEVNFIDIAPRNGGMLAKSCESNVYRDQFLKTVCDKGLKAATDKLLPVGPRDYARELIKSILWRFGLLDIVSRGKRAMK